MQTDFLDRQAFYTQFRAWAEAQPLVRAALLTSTLAVPGARTDIFSDYDIILIMRDILPFHERRDWLASFGPVMALYHDPLRQEDGFPHSGYVVQFDSGLKIDFTLWQVGYLQKIAAQPHLPDELDAGYMILLDKDHLLDALKAPSYQAYIPKPPSQTAYLEIIDNFFVASIYVGKYLWRDDLTAARHIQDVELLQEELIPMLTWLVEIERQWTLRPSLYGRGLKQWLRPALWADLEACYTGPGWEDSWAALFNNLALFGKVAREVGQGLGYAYPEDTHRRASAYLQKIKEQDR